MEHGQLGRTRMEMKVTREKTGSAFNRYHRVNSTAGQEVVRKLKSTCADTMGY
jgi:hypothetical protein